MKAQIKNALMTTGLVLITIYALRQVGVKKNLVHRALAG